MEENLYEVYRNQLATEDKPELTLSNMYWEIFSRPHSDSDIRMFKKLVKVYGKVNLFNSLLDMYSMPDIKFDNISGLITFFARKNAEESYSGNNKILDTKSLQEKIDKVSRRHLHIPSIEE
jgi:hypothetical protein